MSRDRKENPLDFLKGLLMLGVIYGHAVTALKGPYSVATPLALLVRTYDMPFFMVISGYLLSKTVRKYPLGRHLANRVGGTVVPTVFLGGIFAVITYLFLGSFSLLNCVRYILNIWFIWASVISAVVILLVEHLIPWERLRLAAYALIAVGFHFLPVDTYNLSYMFPFYVLGLLYSRYFAGFLEKRKRVLLPAAVCLYLVAFSFWKSDYTIWNAGGYVLENTPFVLGATAFRFGIAVLGCLWVKPLAYGLYRLLQRDYPGIRRWICEMGQHSLVYYVAHAFLVSQVLSTLVEICCGRLASPPLWIENAVLLQLVVAPCACAITALLIRAGICVIRRFAPNIVQKLVFGIKFFSGPKQTV